MDKRAEIIVHGRVQKAGFRDYIDEVAFNLDLNGYVKNLDDGTVQIICEGEEGNIKELLEKINITQYPIRVEKIDVAYKKPTDEYKAFDVVREEDLTTATYERMDAAVRYMREMNSNLSQKIDGVGGKIDYLGGNLGDKIDNLGGKIDGVGDNLGDKIDNLGDNLGGKIDRNRIEITSEISSTRDDFRSHFDERISMIERDVAQIKAKVMLKC